MFFVLKKTKTKVTQFFLRKEKHNASDYKKETSAITASKSGAVASQKSSNIKSCLSKTVFLKRRHLSIFESLNEDKRRMLLMQYHLFLAAALAAPGRHCRENSLTHSMILTSDYYPDFPTGILVQNQQQKHQKYM